MVTAVFRSNCLIYTNMETKFPKLIKQIAYEDRKEWTRMSREWSCKSIINEVQRERKIKGIELKSNIKSKRPRRLSGN